MDKLKLTLTASFLILLIGCGGNTTRSNQGTSSPPTNSSTTQGVDSSPHSSATVPPVSTNTSPAENLSSNTSPSMANSAVSAGNQTIVADGIGPAKVGMTLGQLKQLLKGKAEFKMKSPFMANYDAIAIVQGGKEQYYILYPTGAPMRDVDIIEALVTDNPNYQTPEGIGPGTPLKQAQAAYGEPNLSYHQANESREYVKFTKQPSKDIAFRLGAANDGSLAGIYPATQKEFNQTKEFKKTATIRFVEVYCGQNCPPPALP